MAPEMAPAASFRQCEGFLSPSGVKYCLTHSYVMKLRPTWMCQWERHRQERMFAHIWCNTSYCRYVTTVKSNDAPFSLVYVDHYSPHPRHVLLFRLCKRGKVCGLHGKPGPDEIQRIGECHGCYPRKSSAQKVFPRRCRGPGLDPNKLLRIGISMGLDNPRVGRKSVDCPGMSSLPSCRNYSSKIAQQSRVLYVYSWHHFLS